MRKREGLEREGERKREEERNRQVPYECVYGLMPALHIPNRDSRSVNTQMKKISVTFDAEISKTDDRIARVTCLSCHSRSSCLMGALALAACSIARGQ